MRGEGHHLTSHLDMVVKTGKEGLNDIVIDRRLIPIVAGKRRKKEGERKHVIHEGSTLRTKAMTRS